MRSAFKWVLLLPAIILFILIFKSPAFAATETNQISTSDNPYMAPSTNPDVPKNTHTLTQSIFLDLISTGYCQLTGTDPLSQDHKCLGIDPNTHKVGYVENGGGLLGITGNLISMTFKMPTSSSQYFGYLASNFGLTKKAFAANPCSTLAAAPYGAGFCSVQPLTNIWIQMRNIVYLIFTIVFIVIGLGIMLRIHIDPRTVMTLENQIPKIIIGILLVSFSLAIAGFLIDIMYVVIYLIGNVLIDISRHLTAAPGGTLADFATQYGGMASSSSPIDATKWFNNSGAAGASGDLVGGVANAMSSVLTTNIHGPQFFGVDLLQVVSYLVLFLVFLLAFWISLLRVWISLVIAYIMILLDIIFAPFWFVAGLLPGSSLGVGAWFRDILANLMVFPTTIAMFALAIIFLNMSTGDGQLFNPPLVGGFKYGFGDGTFSAFTIGRLIAFGFIFMTPQALTIVKSAIKAPKFNVGPVFQPATASAGVLRSSVGAAASFNTSQTDKLNASGWKKIKGQVLG